MKKTPIKEGDTVVIMKTGYPPHLYKFIQIQDFIGKFEPFEIFSYRGARVRMGNFSDKIWGFVEGEYICAYPERDLKKIEDPGDEAVDETLEWCPVKEKENVTM